MNTFDGFVDAVFITGAGRGIGAAIARRLGAAGVPVACLSQHTAGSVAEEIRTAGGTAEFIQADLADSSATTRAVARWLGGVPYRRLGVVLAAAVTGAPGGLTEGSLPEWAQTMQVNLFGNFAVLQALLPRMIEARFGRIVTFAGGGAAYAYPLFSGYSASKVAVVRATENLHEELAGRGDFLTVCLAPGAIETDMLKSVRAAGGAVRTVAKMEEPVEFVERFLAARHCAFSGCFVHVRDPWTEWLNQPEKEFASGRWLLRRIEP